MWGYDNGVRPTPNSVNDTLFANIALDVAADFRVPPPRAWDLVSDPTRIGEFSAECKNARWIEGDERPAVGARFEGTNQSVLDDGQIFEWTRPCTITRCERPSLYAYVTHDRWDHPATEWSFSLDEIPTGCRVTHSMRLLPGGLSGLRLAADEDPSSAQAMLDRRLPRLLQGIQETLQRMKSCLEA